MGQSSLEKVIITALAKNSCEVEHAELVSFEQSADFVTVHLIHRQEGKDVSETANFQYLVGTDGAHSVVRRQLGLPFIGESRTENMLVGDISVEGLATDVSKSRLVLYRLLIFFSAMAHVGRCYNSHVRHISTLAT